MVKKTIQSGNFTPSATLVQRDTVKPANWPTVTQAGPTPSATKASAADPNLLSGSYALNLASVASYTAVHTGDLTYYDTGSTSCGDIWDDSSFTAAVSHEMYDSWPGATANPNRNPVCGPYSPGRQVMNSAGAWITSVSSSVGTIQIGGDGLPSCLAGSPCHIPLTATITNAANGKSVKVKVVDRCGGCALNDIDITPTAFAAIADINAGRITSGITWQFDQFSVPGAPSGGSSTTTTTTKSPTTTSKIAPPTTTSTFTSASQSSPSSGACAVLPAWSSSVAYTGGMSVTYGGHRWTAQWWTQGEIPTAVAWGVWVDKGAC